MDEIIHLTSGRIVFVTGLPFSGQKKLIRLLKQNPRFSGMLQTTPVLDIIAIIMRQWNHDPALIDQTFRKKGEQHRTQQNVQLALKGLIDGFWMQELNSGKIVLDRHRGWLGFLGLLVRLYPDNFAMIYCKRGLKDIAARLMSRVSDKRPTIDDIFSCNGNHCSIVGLPWTRYVDARDTGIFDRIPKNSIQFLEYEDMRQDMPSVVERLHTWLNVPMFPYEYGQCVFRPRLDIATWLTTEEQERITMIEMK